MTHPTPRDQDRRVAEALGWTHIRCNEVAWFGKPPDQEWTTIDIPHYSTDIAAAWSIETDIEQRGLTERYIEQLCFAIDGDGSSTGLMQRYWRDKMHPEHVWLLVHATADQRVRAFLAVQER